VTFKKGEGIDDLYPLHKEDVLIHLRLLARLEVELLFKRSMIFNFIFNQGEVVLSYHMFFFGKNFNFCLLDYRY